MAPTQNAPVMKAGRTRAHSRDRRVLRFLVLAVLVHAELLLLVGVGAYLLAPRDADVKARLAEAKEPESIDIGMMDDDVARRIVADLERQEEQRKAEEVKKEIESVKAPGQVVDVPAPREEKRPDIARFASEHDTSVTREMRRLGKFDPEAREGDAGGETKESQPQQRAVPAQPTPPTPPRLATRESQVARGLMETPAAGQPSSEGSENGAVDPEAPSPDGVVPRFGKLQMRLGSEGASTPGRKLSLMPSSAQLARAIGTGTEDALKDVDDGEETALNSKKWKFSSFFNRVKHQVQEHWHPDEVYSRRDPSRSIYGRT
ncbi:MAG TPA: hypothetical protein VHU40_17665, partial [Polyangia bacterium]|nr:hypothetical protein [Polyangia bacterium]